MVTAFFGSDPGPQVLTCRISLRHSVVRVVASVRGLRSPTFLGATNFGICLAARDVAIGVLVLERRGVYRVARRGYQRGLS